MSDQANECTDGGMTFLRPAGWAPPRGYANGVIAQGRIIVLAGQIGWDPASCRMETDDFAEQAGLALRNIATLLAEADAEPRHLVRLTWFITDRAAYLASRSELGTIYRAHLGAHFPAMSVVVVSALIEERALVEIEAMAVLPA